MAVKHNQEDDRERASTNAALHMHTSRAISICCVGFTKLPVTEACSKIIFSFSIHAIQLTRQLFYSGMIISAILTQALETLQAESN